MATRAWSDAGEVWKSYKSDETSQLLRNILVERYLPLVRENAERMCAKLSEDLDFNDLISAGLFSLTDAIDAFDPDRGVKFETFCVPRIREAMLDELRTMDWVPRLARSKACKLELARQEAATQLDRAPSDREMAQSLRIALPEYEKLACDAAALEFVNLNAKWYKLDS
jgi:RNA polymerase sigma factor FliA